MAVSCDTYSSFIREVFFAELCTLHNGSILFDLFTNGRYYVRYMLHAVIAVSCETYFQMEGVLYGRVM